MSFVDAAHYDDPTLHAQLAAWPAPRRALFLDRDGVINLDHGYVHSAARTDFLPGIFDLVRTARAAGFAPVVVTNQAGIARGLYDEATFLEYTAWVHAQFRAHDAPLFATYYCPHHPTAGIGDARRDCTCRKPQPGMLLAAALHLDIDLPASRLLGDTQKDLDAAHAAGVRDARRFDPHGDAAVFHSLDQALDWLSA